MMVASIIRLQKLRCGFAEAYGETNAAQVMQVPGEGTLAAILDFVRE